MISIFSASKCIRILWFCLLFLSLAHAQEQETVLVTTTLTSTPTSPTPASYTSLSEFKDTVLSISNNYRNEHDACTLTWNDTLADYSRNWAQQCKWKHSVSPLPIHIDFYQYRQLIKKIEWAIRRKPLLRLPQRLLRHRSLGRRTQNVQFQAPYGLHRGNRAFHTVSLEIHDAGWLCSGGLWV